MRYMFELKELLEESFEEISRICSMEHGKILDESRGEVRRGIENVEAAASIPFLMMGYNLEDVAQGIDEEAIRQPIGTFAAICPFNFPAMIPLWFLPYAVATGNTFIVKSSRQVPLSLEKIFEAIDEVGFPDGVINLVNGSRDSVGKILTHPGIAGVSIVGSTPAAKFVYETCARHGKRVQAQGGAHNCLLVTPDADLERSIPNMLTSAYGTAGQRCLAGSIVLAMGDVYEKVRDMMVEGAKAIKVGYGLDEGSHMGPLISDTALETMHGYIETSIKEGATVLVDGRGVKVKGYPNGYYLGPTLFDDVTMDMTIMKEETFGPLLGIMRVKDFEEAVEVINASTFGNAASIFTTSGKYAREFKYHVRAGNIGINIGIAAPVAYFPFAGMKDSFFGDLHGQGLDAINFYTDRKVVISRWF
jgi:malonate-semialdehyde dehydrogenase (acetylating)/methylmalonate-semialdehyde dehydrogenase